MPALFGTTDPAIHCVREAQVSLRLVGEILVAVQDRTTKALALDAADDLERAAAHLGKAQQRVLRAIAKMAVRPAESKGDDDDGGTVVQSGVGDST